MQNRQAIETTLNKLFDAERTARRLHEDLTATPGDGLLDVLTDAIAAATRENDEDEAALRLVRIASLLGEHEGPRALDALIDVLASEHPEARQAAGEEIETLAYDRFKEVAQAIERALKRLPVGSSALPKLLRTSSPRCRSRACRSFLSQFTSHKDPDRGRGGDRDARRDR